MKGRGNMYRKEVKEMTREELEKEVMTLRFENIWGLRAEDFVMTLINEEEDIAQEEIFTEDEMSTERVYQEIYQKIRDEGFYVHDWSEIISYHEFSPQVLKLLKTLSFRDF